MNLRVSINRALDDRVVADVFEADSEIPYCFFLSSYLRQVFVSYSSMEAAAHATLFGILFFKREGIDVISRVQSGKFFTRQECDDFKSCCKYQKSKIEQLNSKNIVSFDRLSEKQLDNLIHETTQSEGLVGERTMKSRLSYFVRYIDHLYMLHNQDNSTPETVGERFDDFKNRMKFDISLIKNTNKVVKDPFEQAIPDKAYFELLDIIKPSHKKNPFTASVRLRNQLIIQILNETSIRLGALCKLKISDLRDDNQASRFLVTRTPNDPTDTRKRPSSQKTNEHIAAISSETMERLKLYIETVRNQYAESHTHDFIFVSSKGTPGKPIAKSSVQSMIDALSKAIKFHLFAHLFRYKWQEVFEVKAKAIGYTHEQINDMRKQACGWSENTKMINIYNEFMHAVNVCELSKIRQAEFMPKLNINKKDL